MDTPYFVIPFLIGMAYLFGILIIKGVIWINGLSKIDRLRLLQLFKTNLFFVSIKEIVLECLLHRKIFRKNPVLGYMHMSLAFGWFLLIVLGHIESIFAEKSFFVPFYLPVFFRYFNTEANFFLSKPFSFLMDLILVFVLSGVVLALIKRFYKNIFGMKRTTRLKLGDRIALVSLWLIFPLRLLAESISANINHNGSFLTNSVGNILNHFKFIELINTPVWFAYSLILGFFFIALPYSRYMHIPTEVLLIFMRNAGIQLKKHTDTYTQVQTYSCSRCGICLDNCQMSNAGISDSQSVYLLKFIRNKNLNDEQLFNCLLCGKCQIDCPVGIDTVNLRITQRIESTLQYNSSYTYLQRSTSPKAHLIYFAGCMSHLTPGITTSMEKFFKIANENYWFLDKEKAPCCGRPLMLAGQYDAAAKLIENNTRQIIDSGAKTLVVSCPICYKVFKEDYNLPNIEVLFHAEYLLKLTKQKILPISKGNKRFVYHDPCELGRGMGMYEQPRELLKMAGQLIPMKNEKQKSYCCGGSLGNLKIKQSERDQIRVQSINEYLSYQPNLLITACPLCKKTFARGNQIKVMDISEIMLEVYDENSQLNDIAKFKKELEHTYN